MEEQVFDCVMPYVQQDNLNSVSLVSRKYYGIDSLTRKHLTVHVHFAPDPKRISCRFPNLESLSLESYSHGYDTADKCHVPVTPWIEHIGVEFKRLKSLSIRNMVVSPSDLKRLADTRGDSLRSLDIRRCKMFSEDGLVDVARYCKDLRSLSLDENDLDGEANGKWLHELALHNTVMESLYFHAPFMVYNLEDVTHIAKKCSNSLVSLTTFPDYYLVDFREVFKHAKKLDHFGIGLINKGWDFSGFEFPPNIRGLRFLHLRKGQFPFLRPYLNQLRELDLECGDLEKKLPMLLF
ncbi:hypothetical protein CTI12_AA295450 [Artemisia annua]|uniref:COI1 F-box domain-containing protein n=1 Tax=Artemisia annua TaxID=35608 RepID=A0A2U1N6S9_ARTAN|nr:hypothetical protein CTI12_AA295450 [Artemisia annua]